MTEPFRGLPGYPGEEDATLTSDEIAVIRSLARLSARWPSTLKLVSMGGNLHVIHDDDERYHDLGDSVRRNESVLYTFEGIPSDGGDW